jgi:hypothetical protein
MKKITFILALILTLMGCASTDPFPNPSSTYSPSVVLNLYGAGKVWSTGYIENKVPWKSKLPNEIYGSIYLIGYKNPNITESDQDKIAIYRGLEIGRSVQASCMIIASEKTLTETRKIEFSSNNSQGAISLNKGVYSDSIYGSVNISRGGVYYYNGDRIIIPECSKTEGDMPGRSRCIYYPDIDHLSTYYAIYPAKCVSNDFEEVKAALNKIENRDKFNILKIDDKIVEYKKIKEQLLGK